MHKLRRTATAVGRESVGLGALSYLGCGGQRYHQAKKRPSWWKIFDVSLSWDRISLWSFITQMQEKWIDTGLVESQEEERVEPERGWETTRRCQGCGIDLEAVKTSQKAVVANFF